MAFLSPAAGGRLVGAFGDLLLSRKVLVALALPGLPTTFFDPEALAAA